MGDKVALPSLSLPKQRTHWSVGVVIAAGVLLLILGAALYAVLQRQQAAEEAYAKREADHAAMIKAETEKVKAETEKASAEAKKKEAEAAASNAAAAQSKAAQASGAGDDASKNKSGNKKKGTKKASGKTTAAAEFARWYSETGGIEGPVLFTSFEQHQPLARVLDRIGQVGNNPDGESCIHQPRGPATHGAAWPATAPPAAAIADTQAKTAAGAP